MNLGHRATVSLVSDPFFLDGKRVFDGGDGSIGVPSEDDPPRARGCYRGVRPLISRHFSQDLWKKAPRTLENIVLQETVFFFRQILLFYFSQVGGSVSRSGIPLKSPFLSLT